MPSPSTSGSTYFVSSVFPVGSGRVGAYTGLFPASAPAAPCQVFIEAGAPSMAGQLDSVFGLPKSTAESMVKTSFEWTGPSTWSPAFQMIEGQERPTREDGP